MQKINANSDRYEGRLIPWTWGLFIFSTIVLVAGGILGWTHCGRQILVWFHYVLPFSFYFDIDLLTDPFLFLFGITQAIMFFYLEHRNARIIGVSIRDLVRHGLGKTLCCWIVAILLVEFVAWIMGVIITNHALLFFTFALQILNLVAIVVVLFFKNSIRGVLGSCTREAERYKKSWLCEAERRKVDIINERIEEPLLVFELLTVTEDILPQIIDELKGLLWDLLSWGEDTDDRHGFGFALVMLKSMEARTEIRKNLPLFLQWVFEQGSKANDQTRLAILFYMMQSSLVSSEDVLKVLSYEDPINRVHYAWCGIWTLYFDVEYKNEGRGEAAAWMYAKYALGTSLSLNAMSRYVDVRKLIMKKTIKRWEGLWRNRR